MHPRIKKKNEAAQIAKSHVDELMEQAKTAHTPKYANRYVEMARNIAMRFRLGMSSENKRMFCQHCHAYLVPGRNLRVRVHQGRLIYYCLECKKFWRKPLN